MYFVYIIKSIKDNSKYTGMTNNIRNRLKQHNEGLSSYTKGHRPWKLMWFCIFPNKTKAEKFEKYLKSGSGIAFMNKRIL